MIKQLFFLFLALSIGILRTAAQVQAPSPSPAADTSRIVKIEHFDRLTLKKSDSAELEIAAGNVLFVDGDTRFYCDSAVKNSTLKTIQAFGHVHIIDSDTIHTYSDYLIYNSETKLAVLERNVKLTDGSGVLTTQNLDYDTNLKIGNYRNGGKVVKDKTVITSLEATYYAELKDVYFKHDVKLKDPAYDLVTDSLIYNTETQLATFVADTYIKDTSNTEIVTSSGYYDLNRKVSRLSGRSTVKDKALTVTGDELAMDDNSGIFEARGNAVMIDTAQGVTVIANEIRANRQNSSFMATQQPLMILKQENDSIYVTADTLYSGLLKDAEAETKTFPEKSDSMVSSGPGQSNDSLQAIIAPSGDSLRIIVLNDDSLRTDSLQAVVANPPVPDSSAVVPVDSTSRYFRGYRHVRIFSDSLQAVCDSLFYNGRDSVFKLFQNPILWANNSQATGDTIFLFTKNKNPSRLRVIENGMMINQVEKDFYNQVSGKTIDAYFIEGALDSVEVIGSPAESIYYLQDEDSSFVGMNTSTGRIIDLYFKDRQLNRVVIRTEPQGTLFPIRHIPAEKKNLRDFKWLEDRRPKSKFELFENIEEIAPAGEEESREAKEPDPHLKISKY